MIIFSLFFFFFVSTYRTLIFSMLISTPFNLTTKHNILLCLSLTERPCDLHVSCHCFTSFPPISVFCIRCCLAYPPCPSAPVPIFFIQASYILPVLLKLIFQTNYFRHCSHEPANLCFHCCFYAYFTI